MHMYESDIKRLLLLYRLLFAEEDPAQIDHID